MIWVSAFLLGGALFGASAWIALRKAQPKPVSATPAPIAAELTRTLTAAPTPSLALVRRPAAPSVPAPIPLPAAVPVEDAASKSALAESGKSPTATLLAIDGSEAIAPTCDALLGGGASALGNGVEASLISVARRALVRGDVDGSQRAFCRLVSIGSVQASVASELAQLLLLRRDAKAALAWAQQAARLEPSSRNLGLLGDALVRAGDLDGAREAWLASTKLQKDDRAAIDKMLGTTLADARASLQHRDVARAERLLRRVLAFDPENVTARTQIVLALTRLGFSESAERWSQHDAPPVAR